MGYEIEIRKEDLTSDLKSLVDVIGLQNVIKLVKERGGECLYVPTVKSITKASRDKMIRDEFNGFNHKELARKFNFTVTYIRRIVNNT